MQHKYWVLLRKCFNNTAGAKCKWQLITIKTFRSRKFQNHKQPCHNVLESFLKEVIFMISIRYFSLIFSKLCNYIALNILTFSQYHAHICGKMSTKGQLISKCPFRVIVSTKIPAKFFLP